MNQEDTTITQQRTEDTVCDMKTCCYYCGDKIEDIRKAKVIYDHNDDIDNIVCSFRCDGIPDEIKDKCACCGRLFMDCSDVCSSCWCAEREL
jgi:hypothetical protein